MHAHTYTAWNIWNYPQGQASGEKAYTAACDLLQGGVWGVESTGGILGDVSPNVVF